MAKAIIFLGPALIASGVGAIFLLVALIGGQSDSPGIIKDTHWMRFDFIVEKPKKAENNQYVGLSYSIGYKDGKVEKDEAGKENVPEAWPLDKEQYKKDTKKDWTADQCKKDCKAMAEMLTVRRLKEVKCEDRCDIDATNFIAVDLCFASVIIAFLSYLGTAGLSGLRLSKDTGTIRLAVLGTAFLGWLFALLAWSFYVANPFTSTSDILEDQIKQCDDTDGVECGVHLGPSTILVLVAWLLGFVPLIANALLPAGGATAEN